ncbi:phage tail assembly chaperone [Povalibacter sp.]|uniref:phage tail assembly chaperone n=1 Tax=Povalibacter sp. TaxID=1962978 RepID=UPI002F401AA3
MTKIKLIPDPTFDATVHIPVPGKEDPTPVRFTFKHRNTDELQKFIRKERSDVDYVLEACEGWELDDAWNRKNVAALLNTYHAAARAIAVTYLTELTGMQPREREETR